MVAKACPVPTSLCVANALGAKRRANAQTASADCSRLPQTIALRIKASLFRRGRCFMDSFMIIPKPFPRHCSWKTATPDSPRSSDRSQGTVTTLANPDLLATKPDLVQAADLSYKGFCSTNSNRIGGKKRHEKLWESSARAFASARVTDVLVTQFPSTPNFPNAYSNQPNS